MLVEFRETGKLHWSEQARESKFPINEYYSRILEQFKESENSHPEHGWGRGLGFQKVFLLAYAGGVLGAGGCWPRTDTKISMRMPRASQGDIHAQYTALYEKTLSFP